MAVPEGYILSQSDLLILRRIIKTFDRMQHYTNAFGREPEDKIDHEEFHTSEIHIAFTPEGGIPANTILSSSGISDQPGSADCQIFRINPNAAPEAAETIPSYTKKVYNLSSEAVSGSSWILTARDKYGKWIVAGVPPTGLSCFPAEIAGAYEPTTGYNAKRMIIRDDGTFEDHPSGFTTDYVYSPDESTDYQVGTRGWLCPSPDEAVDTGSAYGGTGTADSNQRWIFIPVYKTRTHCNNGSLVFQLSTDGGVTWTDSETLGVDCGTGTGTGTGTGASTVTIGGCGWVAGLREGNCLRFTVIDASGRCSDISTAQSLLLSWNGSAWESGFDTPGTSDDDFFYVNGFGHVLFWLDATGVPRLTIDGVYLTWDKCGTVGGDLFIDFSGGGDFCGTGTAPYDCNLNTFTIRIICEACPTHWYCVSDTGACTGTGTNETIIPMELTPYEALLLADYICSGPYDTEAEADEVCGPVTTACCSSNPTPRTLNWTITNITGDCTCITTLSGVVNYNDASGVWESIAFTCPLFECEENATYYVACNTNDLLWYYNNTPSAGGLAATSAQCSPFQLVFDKVTPTGGTYRITFTG